MNRIHLAIFALVAASLACNQPVPGTPTETPTATSLVAVIAVQLTATPEWTATVSKPVVNVRSKPGGAVVGSLRAGDSVEIVACVDKWCQIVEPAGFIWQGCLSGSANPDKLRCEAR